MKILKILLLIVALNCIAGCWHFRSRDLTGEYLDDCSDIEKIKNSIVKIFDAHYMYGEYNNVDSLVWYFRDQDSTYEILVDQKMQPDEIRYGGGKILTISKNECKIIAYFSW